MRAVPLAILFCSFSVPAAAEPLAASNEAEPRAVITVGVDVGNRTRGELEDGFSTLLSIGGELYGGQASRFANLGLVADVTVTLASDDMEDILTLADSGVFGSPTWTAAQLALRKRFSKWGVSAGLGSMEFSYLDKDILDRLDLFVPLANDVYRYARVGVDSRVESRRAVVFASAGARYVFDGTNDVNLGFDAEAGLGLRVGGPLEILASGMYEEFRASSDDFRDGGWRARLSLAAAW